MHSLHPLKKWMCLSFFATEIHNYLKALIIKKSNTVELVLCETLGREKKISNFRMLTIKMEILAWNEILGDGKSSVHQ